MVLIVGAPRSSLLARCAHLRRLSDRRRPPRRSRHGKRQQRLRLPKPDALQELPAAAAEPRGRADCVRGRARLGAGRLAVDARRRAGGSLVRRGRRGASAPPDRGPGARTLRSGLSFALHASRSLTGRARPEVLAGRTRGRSTSLAGLPSRCARPPPWSRLYTMPLRRKSRHNQPGFQCEGLQLFTAALFPVAAASAPAARLRAGRSRPEACSLRSIKNWTPTLHGERLSTRIPPSGGRARTGRPRARGSCSRAVGPSPLAAAGRLTRRTRSSWLGRSVSRSSGSLDERRGSRAAHLHRLSTG